MLPRKKQRQRMDAQPPSRVECRGHIRWVLTKFQCALAGKVRKSTQEPHVCADRLDPHHTPTVGAGGDDSSVVPLCRIAHNLLDSPGWSESYMEQEFGVQFRQMGADLWQEDSYHRLKWHREYEESWGRKFNG